MLFVGEHAKKSTQVDPLGHERVLLLMEEDEDGELELETELLEEEEEFELLEEEDDCELELDEDDDLELLEEEDDCELELDEDDEEFELLDEDLELLDEEDDEELELLDEEELLLQPAGQETLESQHIQLKSGQQIALSAQAGLVARLQTTETELELLLELDDELREEELELLDDEEDELREEELELLDDDELELDLALLLDDGETEELELLAVQVRMNGAQFSCTTASIASGSAGSVEPNES